MKNQKGITLIALVITIIVLLILAGITIAMLTGENGLLTNANKAKVTDIEASVQERVNLGAAAIRLEIAKEVATDPSWDATTHLSSLQSSLLADLNQSSGLAKNAATHWSVETGTNKLTVTYKGSDYDQATNYTTGDATITYVITFTQQGLSVGNPSFLPQHQS